MKKRSLCHLLKNLDIFGFPVSLYYLKQENKKKSLFGASVTVLIALVSLSYLAIILQKVMNPLY